MFTAIIFGAGLLVGWNLPQPAWIKAWQDKLVAYVKGQ